MLRGVIALAVITCGCVTALRGGEAFWLCVPAALLTCTLVRSPAAVVSAGGLVVASAAAPSLWMSARPLPSPALAILVPAASVLVLAALRGRLERERDALLDVALTDPLTGLANRRSLIARGEYEVARHSRQDRQFAVMMLDLDGFKLLNDRFGHVAGDELLRDVAVGLTHATRAQDTVARLGGDEFCVLAPETDRAGAEHLAGRIAAAVSESTAGVETLRGSVGSAVFPDDGRTAAVLMHVADQRLLAAKRERPAGSTRRRAA